MSVRLIGGLYDGMTISHRDFDRIRVEPASSVCGGDRFRYVVLPDDPADLLAVLRDGSLRPEDIRFWRICERHIGHEAVEYRVVSGPITVAIFTRSEAPSNV
jgi:hypothetical protein